MAMPILFSFSRAQQTEMKIFACNKLESFPSSSSNKSPCFLKSCRALSHSLFRVLLFHTNPFYIQLIYFVMLSLLGYLALRVTKPRTSTSFRSKDFDVFFTSVSATTVSSMSTLEMEVFSNTHLIIMTILMLLGGEVFTSLLGLQLAKSKIPKFHDDPNSQDSNKTTSFDLIELGHHDKFTSAQLENHHDHHDHEKPNNFDMHNGMINIKCNSIRCLVYVVLGYLLVVHIVGSSLVSLYITLVPSARQVLKAKGIETPTFAVFTTVSTFANCGFVPTNENMIIFKKNSGLLLLLVPQLLVGNTLYPTCLRFVIWVLEKSTKRVEFRYLLKNYKDLGYSHMLSGVHCFLLAVTVLGFIAVQVVLFCAMEWKSEAMDGMSGYQKFVATIFQTVNSRHAGESVVDLSIISPAILVLFVVMMYLPPYTTFLPTTNYREEEVSENGRQIRNARKTCWVESLIFSQLSYLAIFVILICITEREKMKEDPLNFNVLNITIEVVSAYGNVGFSTGYSCKRQLKVRAESDCKDAWYGFVGRWSMEGKLILILVMFFGRLKKFIMKQGKAWNLS